MKLIVKQYLASLRERNELDAIIPDLLSQLGLNVFSRPGRGTRQDGVDVAAVGSLDGGQEKIYLLSIKQGDLTRSSWDGDAVQSLRPSLNEILDSYIPNRLPKEHKNKDIVICICIGGDIQEQVRPQVEGYIESNTRDNITFEEWNGDKLASMILSGFLREELLPSDSRSQLRKCLALLEDPEVSYEYFVSLLKLLTNKENLQNKNHITIIRQINICLWILFAWARDKGNLESAYLSSEISLLYAWEIAKTYFSKTTKTAEAVKLAFQATLDVYQKITEEYLDKIAPYTKIKHSLSVAVNSSCSIDINLKLFDVLGRMAIGGLWKCWNLEKHGNDGLESREFLTNRIQVYSDYIMQLIINNPILLLPVKDDQIIDISIAVLLLSKDISNNNYINIWLSEMYGRANIAYQTFGQYPCNLSRYNDLLEYTERKEEEYRKEITAGSVLFPMIALWAALFGNNSLYDSVQKFRAEYLEHCTFQFWYPDEDSEDNFYKNENPHGSTLTNVFIERIKEEFLKQAFSECGYSNHFRSLSAVSYGFWPIIIMACRHYRLPMPLHFWEDLYSQQQKPENHKKRM